MLANDPASLIARSILEQKQRLEGQGKNPRLVLMDEKAFQTLEDSWIKSVKDLPWGDSLAYEMEIKRKSQGKMFLGDGSIFDLWVVRVDTVDGAKVY